MKYSCFLSINARVGQKMCLCDGVWADVTFALTEQTEHNKKEGEGKKGVTVRATGGGKKQIWEQVIIGVGRDRKPGSRTRLGKIKQEVQEFKQSEKKTLAKSFFKFTIFKLEQTRRHNKHHTEDKPHRDEDGEVHRG